MPYTLLEHVDAIEVSLFAPLIQPSFPSYETFWQKFVIPLTNRPANIQLRSDAELAALGFGPHHVCLAQLHYTILRQLARCYQLAQDPRFGIDHLVFAMSSLVGSQDVAFELLERFAHPATYNPWLDKRPRHAAAAIKGGKEAQEEWKRSNKRPLQDIRDYRNHLVHGRTPPGIVVGAQAMTPKRGKQQQYFDWRLVTAAAQPPVADFDSPSAIFASAFTTTVTYFETSWQAHIIPNI